MIEVWGKQISVRGKLVRVARLDADKYYFLDDPEAMLTGLRKCGARIDLFTFLQGLPEAPPKYAYPIEWDNLAVLPVTTFEHWLKEQIRFAPRGRIRQAEKKGVTVREVKLDDTLVKGIGEIYNECPIRQGRKFPHYGKSVEKVYQETATYLESSIFIGAYLGDRLIGFVKLVADEAWKQVNLMNIVSLNQFRDKCPTNALIAQAVRSCAERNIPNLVYQNFSYGKGRQDSLSKFKEVNGFAQVNLPRYYVPLTAVGSAALQLGLHRRFVDHIPESIAAKIRELRTNWYHRKFQSPAETS